MKFVASLFFISLSFGLTAMAAEPPANSLPPLTAKELIDLQKIKANIRVLEKDITVYHYYKTTGYPDDADWSMGSKNYRNYFVRSLGIFFRSEGTSTSEGVAGDGIYAAADPEATSIYGTRLLEITIKKGAKIIPANFTKNLAESDAQVVVEFQQMKTALLQAGYPGASQMTYKKNTQYNDGESASPTFYHASPSLRREIMKLGIVAYSYRFNSNCQGTQNAYVLMGRSNDFDGVSKGKNVSLQDFSVVGYSKDYKKMTVRERPNYLRLSKFFKAFYRPTIPADITYSGEELKFTNADLSYWQNKLDNCSLSAHMVTK